MEKALNSLYRVLDLEIKQGYQDKAVVGGIRQFAAFWISQAREQAVDEADKALVEQIAESLTSYSRLPGVEARAETIENIRDKLRLREERLKALEPAIAPPPQPEQPPPSQRAAPPTPETPAESKPDVSLEAMPRELP